MLGKRLYVANDALMHWKYIKKERVNGKWRYYYDDSEYQSAKDNHERTTAEYERAKNLLQTTKATRDSVYEKANADGKINFVEKSAINLADKSLSTVEASTKDVGAKAVASGKTYLGATLKHVTAGTIAKGVAAIKNLFGSSEKTRKDKSTKTKSSEWFGHKTEITNLYHEPKSR